MPVKITKKLLWLVLPDEICLISALWKIQLINAAFLLVEILLRCMLWLTSSEKRRLFGGKKEFKSSFN